MSRMISGRYRLDTELTNARVSASMHEVWLAFDLQTNDSVQINLVLMGKASDVTHHLVMSRSSELHTALPSLCLPLTSYDYDAKNACYYFVYESLYTQSLKAYLARHAVPRDKAIDWLARLASCLAALHQRKITHGNLTPDEILVPVNGDTTSGTAGLHLNHVGLANLVALLDANAIEDGAGHTVGNVLADRDGFRTIARALMKSSQMAPHTNTEADLELLLKEHSSYAEWLISDNLHPDYDEFDQFVPIYSSLQELQRYFDRETRYYLCPTNTAITRLSDFGFITESFEVTASDFLQSEVDRGAAIQIDPANGDFEKSYRLITTQLEMICRPDQTSTPPKCLVIVTIRVDKPAELARSRDMGASVQHRLIVTSSRSVPSTANVSPFLEQMECHNDATETIQEQELNRKLFMRGWSELLEEMKAQLSRFQLPYRDWKQVDNGTALLVDLDIEHDSEAGGLAEDNFPELTEDTIFCLSSNAVDGNNRRDEHGEPVGYLEELGQNKIKLGLLGNVDVAQFKKRGLITIDNWRENVTLSRQQQAIKKLRFQETANPNLAAVLLDPTKLTIGNASEPEIWFQAHLDEQQKTTVRHALATNDIFLIQGPPGTGKTSVIAEMVLQINQRQPEAQILVSSQSNVAVNHALGKITEVHRGLQDQVVRIGRPEKAGSATDLLFERQIERWVEQIRQKGSAFLACQEKDLADYVDADFLIRMLNTHRQKEQELVTRKEELAELKIQLQAIDEQYSLLETMVNETERIQAEVETLLNRSVSSDERFCKIIGLFQTDYLQWAQNLLYELDSHTGMNVEYQKITRDISALEQRIGALIPDVEVSTAQLDAQLRMKLNTPLADLDDPEDAIKQKYALYGQQMERIQRLRMLAKEWSEAIRDTEALADSFLSHCRVVGATCIGVAGHPIVNEVNFDWVIIDEAGRATPPEILVPMVRGRRIILVGDHRQLPPVISGEADEAARALWGGDARDHDLKASLFQELFEKTGRSKRELTKQYRMHPAIGNLISHCFYEDRLISMADPLEKLHGLRSFGCPVMWYSTKGTTEHNEQKEQRGSSYYNQSEADVIEKLLGQIDKEYPIDIEESLSVGIIAGYQAQKLHLRKIIGAHKWTNLNENAIEIDTVDAYQGRERDIIVYSIVRSNPSGNIGFLRDARRLNVALSRARKLLIIVGDDRTAGTRQSENPFYEILSYIHANPNDCQLKVLK